MQKSDVSPSDHLRCMGTFQHRRRLGFASHIALSGLMALFPFLIFATSLASFLGTREFANTAVHVIFDMWPSNIAAPIANEVKSVLTVQRHGL